MRPGPQDYLEPYEFTFDVKGSPSPPPSPAPTELESDDDVIMVDQEPDSLPDYVDANAVSPAFIPEPPVVIDDSPAYDAAPDCVDPMDVSVFVLLGW